MEFGNLTPREVACDVGLNLRESQVHVILICATWFLLYKNDKCGVMDAPKSLCMYIFIHTFL